MLAHDMFSQDERDNDAGLMVGLIFTPNTAPGVEFLYRDTDPTASQKERQRRLPIVSPPTTRVPSVQPLSSSHG